MHAVTGGINFVGVHTSLSVRIDLEFITTSLIIFIDGQPDGRYKRASKSIVDKFSNGHAHSISKW